VRAGFFGFGGVDAVRLAAASSRQREPDRNFFIVVSPYEN
jgi:hypothetical protein